MKEPNFINQPPQTKSQEVEKIPTKNTKESILNQLRKESYDFADFSSPENLNASIDYDKAKYLELFVLTEKAIKENRYSPSDLEKLFNCAFDSRMRLAIIENLPQFKETSQNEEVRKILEDIIVNYNDRNIDNRYKQALEFADTADAPFIEYQTDFEESVEYDTIITAAIENLAQYGSEAESNLFSAFFESRKKIAQHEKEMIKELKEEGRYSETKDEYWGEEYFIDDDGDLSDREMKDLSETGYLYNAKILQEISKLGTQRSVDFAIQFIKDDDSSAYIYKNELVSIFEKADINYSADKLLELSKHKDIDIRKRALSCLLRLEFGKINISEEGVRYLEKTFDLGESNNETYFVQRLTAKGHIGIFNNESVLQKYFKLENLTSEQERIKPKIHELTYETFFLANKNETPEQKKEREGYLQEFKESYFDFYENAFFEKTGVRFNNLNLREQLWFLVFYKNSDNQKKEELLSFASKYKENGLKSFLSLEFERNDGNKILEIGSRLDFNDSSAVFSKIAELADLADMEESELKELFLKKGSKQDISGLRLNLLEKTHQALINFSSASKIELLTLLKNKRVEIEVFSALLKSLKQSGQEVDFEMIRDLDLDISRFGEKLDENDARKVIEMTRENWQGQVPALVEAYAGEKLESALLENSSKFQCYSLKYKGEIIAFMKFERVRENELFASSFGVSKDLHGLKVGTEMLEKIIQGKSKRNIIHATTSPRIPVGTVYVEKYGFTIDGFIPNMQNTGEPALSISLDAKSNRKYRYRNEEKDENSKISPKEIMAASQEYDNLDNLIGNESIILHFDMQNEFSQFQETMKKLLLEKDASGRETEGQEKNNKYTITRYLQDKSQKDADVRYFVFEKITP